MKSLVRFLLVLAFPLGLAACEGHDHGPDNDPKTRMQGASDARERIYAIRTELRNHHIFVTDPTFSQAAINGLSPEGAHYIKTLLDEYLDKLETIRSTYRPDEERLKRSNDSEVKNVTTLRRYVMDHLGEAPDKPVAKGER